MAKSSKFMQVAASPFNGVKIELLFAIIFAVLLCLVSEQITSNKWLQLALLLVYSLLMALWLIIRIKRIVSHEKIKK